MVKTKKPNVSSKYQDGFYICKKCNRRFTIFNPYTRNVKNIICPMCQGKWR
jgi:DNA-directed RNA polymerase subunit RPC12/RpoP